MTPDELRTLSDLLDQATDLPPANREAWLAALQGDALRLAPTLRELLAKQAAGETGDLIDQLPQFTAPAGTALRMSEFRPGASIGPYRLLRELGRGGMGEVWLAERSDGQLQRRVALKLPILSTRRSVLVQRFTRERDILGSLAHAHIARLYDAGVAEDGQPYLALEHVEGQPITAYCDEHRLDVRGRVQLLQQVLQAVQYAHAHLVIHRDLKPNNVLVTAEGQAMLLDFGIAKLLQEDEPQALETDLTREGGRAMTLAHAAPEQVSGGAISIATDIWALGILLYELLTGRRPFEGSRRDLEHAILTLAPERPMALPADLATIMLKALQKAPAERYATVNAMAEDLVRWSRGEPVLAQRDSAWYRARKFVGRYRAAVGLMAFAAVALIGGGALAAWQALEARREAARAGAVQQFVIELFRANSAQQTDPVRARQTTARELLDLGAARVASALPDQPESRLALLSTLGQMYLELGLWFEASRLSAQQLALARQTWGQDDRRTVEIMIDHASALTMRDSVPAQEVEALLAEAERILDAAGERASLGRARLHQSAVRYWTDRSLSEAQRHAERAVAIHRQQFTPASQQVASLEALAGIALRRGDWARAQRVMDEALALARPLRLSEHVMVPLLRRAGEIHSFVLDVPRADSVLREAMSTSLRVNGPAHGETQLVRRTLARHLGATARRDEARVLAAQVLAEADASAVSTAPLMLRDAQRRMFEVYWQQGDLATARSLVDAAMTALDPGAPDSFEHADLLIDLAMVENASERPEAAQRLIQRARAMAKSLAMPRPSLMAGLLSLREAEIRLAAGDADAALSIAAEQLGYWPADGLGVAARLAELQAVRILALVAIGRSGDAVAAALAAEAELSRAPARPYLADADAALQMARARAAVSAGDWAAATALSGRALALYGQAHVRSSPWRAAAQALHDRSLARLAAG